MLWILVEWLQKGSANQCKPTSGVFAWGPVFMDLEYARCPVCISYVYLHCYSCLFSLPTPTPSCAEPEKTQCDALWPASLMIQEVTWPKWVYSKHCDHSFNHGNEAPHDVSPELCICVSPFPGRSCLLALLLPLSWETKKRMIETLVTGCQSQSVSDQVSQQ